MAKRTRIILCITGTLITLFLLAACAQPGSTKTVAGNRPAGALLIPPAGLEENDGKIAQYEGEVPLPPDIARIKQRGKLIVAMYHDDRAPFFYTDQGGKLTGIDPTMARDIARRLGVNIEFDRTAQSFDAVVDTVVRGKADIGVSKLSVTLNRAQRASFTINYVEYHQSLLVNRLKLAALQAQNPGSDTLSLLMNTQAKIAVQKGTSYVDYAKLAFPRAQIVTMENQEIFRAAYQGDVLAAFDDENETGMFLKQNPEMAINVQSVILYDRIDPIGIAVSPQDQHLLYWLNVYLDQATKNSYIKQLLEKYQGETK